jgi:hypothetical protein
VATLTDKKSTGIPVLDEMAWGRWPHYLTKLMHFYAVPPSFCVATLFLWDATVGSADGPCGEIALSQIPVRTRELRKYLAAYCKAGFFEKIPAKYGSPKGSDYWYDEKKTPEEWHRFFDAIAKACELGGLADNVKPESFGNMVASAMRDSKPVPPSGPVVPVDDSTKARVQEAQSRINALGKRKAKD